jgi:hypothetical protein
MATAKQLVTIMGAAERCLDVSVRQCDCHVGMIDEPYATGSILPARNHQSAIVSQRKTTDCTLMATIGGSE